MGEIWKYTIFNCHIVQWVILYAYFPYMRQPSDAMNAKRVPLRFENRSKGFSVHCSIPKHLTIFTEMSKNRTILRHYLDKSIILGIYVFIFHPFFTIFRRIFSFYVNRVKQNGL